MATKAIPILSGAAVPQAWRSPLMQLAIAAAIILALLWRDAFAMMQIWWTSSTFNHCLLIVPILGWLVAQRAPELAKLTPRPWWPGLIWGAGGALLWLLGDAAGVAIARQTGLVILLQSAVITLLGAQISRGLLFPLAFAFALVPFGEELVPPLQTFTAKLSMILLGWTGVPAHIEGVFISTPNGYFEVAEACSGAKFLIAMAAYAILVAHVCFQSVTRRSLFLAGALITPVLANGLRAFATIWVAEHHGRSTAVGFDHVVYGWFFFGLVIAIVMAVAWRWFDRSPNDSFIAADRLPPMMRFPVRPAVALAVLGSLIVLPVAWSSYTQMQANTRTVQISLPSINGWDRVEPDMAEPWSARFAGASATAQAQYRSADGQRVDVVIAAYTAQSDGRELVGFGQGAIDPDSEWAWSSTGPDLPGALAGKGRWDRFSAPGPVQREAVSFYRVGGVTSGRGVAVKLATLKARLLGQDQTAVAVIISAESRPNAPAEAAMREFLKAMGDVDAVADRAVAVQ
jgi:exosortase A